ncbi:MAG TPA: hypothetical protein VEJ41_07975 [Candidatus Acidoferrales bacterium]|nr:hypothetical protein [Candidatus Acidoferrales bacterium]
MKTADATAMARELDARILELIAAPASEEPAFNAIALDLFAYQYAYNRAYSALCDRLGHTPAHVTTWADVPAIPAASFGDVRLACFSPDRTRLRFASSGTTRAGGHASMHEMDTTELYDAALEAQFRRWVMPDLDRMPMVFLSPSYRDAPASSLAYMCSRLFDRCASGGGFFIRDEVLDAAGATTELRSASTPVLVFGTAFGFVHFLDTCTRSGDRFSLPAGSRLIETGGFKGKSRSVERDRLYDLLARTFGIPLERCASEYGMCELTSQWYDAHLADALDNRPRRIGIKVGPHWTRMAVVDPITALPVSDGSEGLLQVFDLANRGSVACVLTADLVRRSGDGFIYLGRSPAAAPKGCSIAVDSMLRSDA